MVYLLITVEGEFMIHASNSPKALGAKRVLWKFLEPESFHTVLINNVEPGEHNVHPQQWNQSRYTFVKVLPRFKRKFAAAKQKQDVKGFFSRIKPNLKKQIHELATSVN
jgi:hypothetical protein